MSWFIAICALLALGVLVSLGVSLRRASRVDADLNREIELAAREENIAITRERLALLPQDGSQDRDRLELEAALADDLGRIDETKGGQGTPRKGIPSAIVLLVAIPVAAAVLYTSLGNTGWVRQATLPTAEEIRNNPRESLDQLLARLEQALEAEPDNPQGWALAGRTYMSVGRYEDAEQAFAEANQLQPDDANLLAAWADASLLVNDSRFLPVIANRIEQALVIDPLNVNALWIAGMGNLSLEKPDKALGYLTRLQPLLAGEPDLQQQVNTIVAQVQSEQATNGAASPPDPGPSISVDVAIDPSLLKKFPADTPVFVFARAPGGPPFPLAAQRLTAGELPATVVLDESSAMMPGQTIATVDQVEVVARLSPSGQPIAQPGDVSSAPVVVDVMAGATASIVVE